MPFYEYRCEKGHTFEVMQRMTDDPLVTCQTCTAKVQRVFHPVAVHFKGSGFYSTDYAAKRKGGDSESGGGEKSGGGESKSGGGESKPDSASKAGSKTTGND